MSILKGGLGRQQLEYSLSALPLIPGSPFTLNQANQKTIITVASTHH